jgi:hypothetical protein
MKEYLKKERNGLAPHVMSIPGTGIAAALLAYLGDGSRFSSRMWIVRG